VLANLSFGIAPLRGERHYGDGWPLFMVSYMLVLAYVASLITFQGGRLLGFS
jgi:Fe2+ transport system protein B